MIHAVILIFCVVIWLSSDTEGYEVSIRWKYRIIHSSLDIMRPAFFVLCWDFLDSSDF